jgi:hypothetical protein
MSTPFEGAISKTSNDVIVPLCQCQVQHTMCTCETCRNSDVRRTTGRTFWPKVMKIPVLHVRQGLGLTFVADGECRWRHKRCNDLQDSAVLLLGRNLSLAEEAGDNRRRAPFLCAIGITPRRAMALSRQRVRWIRRRKRWQALAGAGKHDGQRAQSRRDTRLRGDVVVIQLIICNISSLPLYFVTVSCDIWLQTSDNQLLYTNAYSSWLDSP